MDKPIREVRTLGVNTRHNNCSWDRWSVPSIFLFRFVNVLSFNVTNKTTVKVPKEVRLVSRKSGTYTGKESPRTCSDDIYGSRDQRDRV